MCGIAGIVHRPELADTISLMVNSLEHRGPDAQNVYADNNISLGHTRLSIFDTSSAGNQPMVSASGRYIISYNGEIYNFKELALKWQVNTRTGCDTEVLLEGFEKFGIRILDELNGMFAFAVWDKTEEKLWLGRDRAGKKPLFYTQHGGGLVFASEILAIKQVLPLSVNNSSIPYFLHLGFVPEPLTSFLDVFQLEAGCFAEYSTKGFSITRWWNYNDKFLAVPKTQKSEQQLSEELDTLLNNAVKLRLQADVPVGIFLSGGIDSSLITAMSVRHSSQKVRTYSIGFDNPQFNELQYAGKVASLLDTQHTEYVLSATEATTFLEKLTETYGNLYADSSAIPTMMISKLARKDITVALSGEGSDELFMGYGSARWAQRLAHPLVRTFHGIIAAGLSLAPNEKANRLSAMFGYNNSDYFPAHILSQEQYCFSMAEISKLLITSENKCSYTLNTVGLQPKSAQSLFDFEYYLKNDLLPKLDRASMRYALECRAPFLDYKVVEWAAALPQHMKLRGREHKYILKKVLSGYLPDALFHRPKRGFSIPLAQWMRHEIKPMVDDYLSENTTKKVGLLNPTLVQKLYQRFLAGDTYLYQRVWLVMLLHRWYLQNA